MVAGSVAYASPHALGFSPPQASRAGFQQPPVAQVRTGSSGQTEIGALFRQIRRALGLSLPQIANVLQTRIEVISALETGDVQTLPDWSETTRIVSRYTGLAQIDAGPVLSLLRRTLEQQARTSGRATARQRREEEAPVRRRQEPSERWAAFRAAFVQPVADAASAVTRLGVSRQAREEADDAAEEPLPSRFGSLRLDARKTAGLVAAVFLIVAYFAQGSTLQASLATLHPPLVKLMRSAQDYLLHRSATVHEGLRWIEVDDPRSRKADKLVVRR